MMHRNTGAAAGGERQMRALHDAGTTHAEKMRVITGVIMCILLAALDQTVVLPAIPQMAVNLGAGGGAGRAGAHLSWVVSAYLLTTTATTPIYGKLSDQLGRRAVLVPAIGVFLAACVLCALAGSVPALIAGRALQGLGGGALMSVAQAAVGDVVSPRERGKYQAWFAGVWAFASVVGPVLGGLVVQHFSWRWIFWANLPVGFLAMGLCWRGLAGLRPAGRRGRIDFVGAFLLLVGVSAVLAAMSFGGAELAWGSAQEMGLVAVGGLVLGVLFGQQKRVEEPLFPAGLVGHAGYRSVLMISVLNAGAMFAAIFLLPLLLQGVFGASPAGSGLEVMPFLGTTTLGAFAGGQLARLTGRPKNIMAAGMAVSAAGFLAMAMLPVGLGVAWAVAVSGVMGLGIGAVMPNSIVAAQSHAAGRDMGAATGILLLTRSLGGAFGATLAGAVLAGFAGDALAGFRVGFLVGAAMLVGAAVVAWRMENFVLRGTVAARAGAE